MLKKTILASILSGMVMGGAQATISDDVIRVGFITDMSGVYADVDGPASIEAIKLAIEDVNGNINGKKIELLSFDHQHKTDLASAKAREWIDQDKVDVIIGGTNSAVALAISKVAAEKKIPYINSGAGSTQLTNQQCAPFTIHYAYNTKALANVTGSAVVQNGGKNWFFVTADYAFGHSLEKDTTTVIKKAGGRVKGSVNVPLSTNDFSSYMLQAQASGAQILGLANAGLDFVNSIKAAREFGVTPAMKPAGLLVFLTDVHSLGLEATQGLYLAAPWYWDQNEASRKWSARFEKATKRKPTFVHVSEYSVASNYFKAVKETGTDSGEAIMKWFKSTPINDVFIENGTVRPDGLLAHQVYLYQVKTPAESKGEWDYYKKIQRVDADDAYGPASESTCKL